MEQKPGGFVRSAVSVVDALQRVQTYILLRLQVMAELFTSASCANKAIAV